MNLTLEKNDKRATLLIVAFSIIVFAAVTILEKVTLNVNIGFNPHLLAFVNAIINSVVAMLLVAGLISAKQGRYAAHKKIMLTAMVLSIVFLVTYIAHHLFAGSTLYGDVDKSGTVDDGEKAAAGASRVVYIVLLSTHISLAGISLPLVLFTAYRALINENAAHRKLAKITWPLWFYVAVTGPVVYWMISKYY